MGPNRWRHAPALVALLEASSYEALAKCRKHVSTRPSQSENTKAAIITDLERLCQNCHVHENTSHFLLQNHTVCDLRAWIATLRQYKGIILPTHGYLKQDLLNALASFDLQQDGMGHREGAGQLEGNGEGSQGVGPSLRHMRPTAEPLRDQSRAPERGSPERGRLGCRPQSPGEHQGANTSKFGPTSVEGVLVSYGTTAEPVQLRRKLGKKWQKKWRRFHKATQASRSTRASRSKDLVQAMKETIKEHPYVTVGVAMQIVSKKTGIILTGPKYKERRLFFDRQLIKLTPRRPTRKRTKTSRFTLAVSVARRH